MLKGQNTKGSVNHDYNQVKYAFMQYSRIRKEQGIIFKCDTLLVSILCSLLLIKYYAEKAKY